MNTLFFVLLSFLLIDLLIHVVVEILNVKHTSPHIPRELEDVFDKEQVERSQCYLRENTRFGIIQSLFFKGLLIAALWGGLFGSLDSWVRDFDLSSLMQGLLFFGALFVGYLVLQLPFSAYHTFVIEERYGFNRTTPSTFVGDWIKGLLLGGVLGALVLSGVLWFFEAMGMHAWLYCWGALSAFSLIMAYLAPTLLLPLFNTFSPLPEGELRSAIENYAKEQDFQLNGIFTMDGSKRSSKANALFTGFGRFRRIILYDTLVKNHTTDELLAVLAHEMGHFKRGHIFKGIALNLLSTGLLLYLLSWALEAPEFSFAIGVSQPSIYAGLLSFFFLYIPVEFFLSLLMNGLSRKHEFEADAYAAETTGSALPLIAALKKLSRDTLSNLNPHPLKVLMEYSHPPLLQRIRALRS